MNFRSIFHIRLQNFELQAERMLDAALKSRAVAIISAHNANGTIVAISPEAGQEGLCKGMKVSLARKMSHSTRLLPYNRSLYSRMHNYLYQTVARFSPLVEPAVFGQFYMDMTGMNGIYKNDLRAADMISKRINEVVHLENHIGISSNKLLSRISTSVVPERIYKIDSGEESHFLAPLHSRLLPTSAQPSVERMLRFLFLRQVQDVQFVMLQKSAAQTIFSRYYKPLAMEAKGMDTSAVQPPRKQDHIIEQTILPEDTNDEEKLCAIVRQMAGQVGFKLRRRSEIARHMNLEIHYTDGYRSERMGSLKINDEVSVVRDCLELFFRANIRRNRIRTIIIDASKFQTVVCQLDLFSPTETQHRILAEALDHVRRKYGFTIIKTAA
jgi:DNA polymerase-4